MSGPADRCSLDRVRRHAARLIAIDLPFNAMVSDGPTPQRPKKKATITCIGVIAEFGNYRGDILFYDRAALRLQSPCCDCIR
jgi:hypothetical protein